jgi:hypothetical protein
LPDARPFDPQACAAPLPRSPQWCDGSAFLNHGRLMEQAFNTPPIPEFDTVPVMYQGASDDFLGPHHDVPLPDEHDGIDFEGEFGVVVANVPMGVSPDDAVRRVRLIVQLNDWSLRAFGPREMKTGFGFLQAKPPRALRPSRSRRTNWASIGATVACICVCTWTGMSAGSGIRGEMSFGFGELITCGAYAQAVGGDDRRFRHGVERGPRRRVRVHCRAARDRDDRRKGTHTVHAVWRPRSHDGSRRRGRHAVRVDRPAGRARVSRRRAGQG